MEINGNGIVAEQKCKRIGRRDPDSLWSDPNMENWKEMSRNKEIDGNRRKTRKERMTEQSGRQRWGTEWTEIVIERTEMVGNRRECHGKAGERWIRSEKIRYMTQFKLTQIHVIVLRALRYSIANSSMLNIEFQHIDTSCGIIHGFRLRESRTLYHWERAIVEEFLLAKETPRSWKNKW